MLEYLIAKKKKTDFVHDALSKALFASTVLSLLATLSIIIASKTGYTAVALTEWYSRFKDLLFLLLAFDLYALLPLLFIIASLDYYYRRKKFLPIHKDYTLVKFPLLAVIGLAILLIIFTAIFSTYSMLGALLAGGFFDYLQDIIITSYILTVVLLTFFGINLNLDRQYILLSEKLLADNPNDVNLPLRVNLAFKERRVRFRELSDNPWESTDGSLFGGSSADSGGGGSSSGGGASDDW